MKKHNSENFQDYCVFYKDKELPAIHKTNKFMKALILDSIKDQEHPLNQLIEKKQTFVPFINERDSMGKLISSESYHRKRKSEASSLFNSPKNSHVFLSKNSISNTCSIYENQLPASKLKLKNLLGSTPENTELFQSTLLASQCEFKQTFQFNSKRTQLTFRTHKKNNSLQNKLPQFIKEQKTKEFKLFKQPNTPQATRFYRSNFIIEMFNQNKIPENKLYYILLIEKMQKLQTELIYNLSANERRRTFVKLDGKRRVKLSIMHLISDIIMICRQFIFDNSEEIQQS